MLVFVKGRGTCGSGERNVKIWIDFRMSPRLSLTSPLSQEREKSSRPVFTVGNHFFQTLAKMASGLKQVLAKMKQSCLRLLSFNARYKTCMSNTVPTHI